MNWQCSCDTYKYIYKFLSFKFNSYSMLWWVETELFVNSWVIEIVLDLLRPLIPHTVASWLLNLFVEMVIYLLCIPYVLSVIVHTFLTSKRFFFMIINLYVCTVCFPVHQSLFSYNVFFPYSISVDYSLNVLKLY